ncbi:hypothetical protein FNH22_14575 [Fulvivirga sp. M361]|uniref:hypothetical protein n=1 Tax=Fulvivirga sp. M361 TaxID=2594266 RepID=UPI001179FD85|nr:hypothetical protein [Fulvivirga sp. M361]TRX58280.1 hypothetical protein FNH22_14575 [Fulvivirga sp. M361]
MASEIAYSDPLEMLRDKAGALDDQHKAMETLSVEERKQLEDFARESQTLLEVNIEEHSVAEIIESLEPLSNSSGKKARLRQSANTAVRNHEEKTRRIQSGFQDTKNAKQLPGQKIEGAQDKITQHKEKLKAKHLEQGGVRLARQYYRGLKLAYLNMARSRREKSWMASKFKRFERRLDKHNVKFGSPDFIELLQQQFPELQWEMTVPAGLSDTFLGDSAIFNTPGQTDIPSSISPQQNGLANKTTETQDKNSPKVTSDNETEEKLPLEQNKDDDKERQLKEEGKKAPGPQQDPDQTEGLKEVLKNKPTDLLKKAPGLAENVREETDKKQSEIKKSLPEVPTPTGLEAGERKLPEKSLPEIADAISFQKENEEKPEVTDENINLQKTADQVLKETPDDITDFPDKLPAVKVDIGPVPKIPLEGASDPGKTEEFKTKADERIVEEKKKVDNFLAQDKGLDQIVPKVDDEVLKVGTFPDKVEAFKKIDVVPPQEQLKEVEQKFDAQAQPNIQQQIDEQQLKLDEAGKQLEKDTVQSKVDFDAELASEIERTSKLQKEAQGTAQSDTADLQKEWQTENEQKLIEYEQENAIARENTGKQIQDQMATTDQEITNKLSDAQKDADKATLEANEKAAKEKEKVEEDKSWWDKATDFIGSVFDKLKQAVNNIFDGLIKLVNKVIEAAKVAVSALIDVAKNLVIGFIQAFGEVLKALVNVVFAAFPAIAEKFERLIESAIQAAIDVVDRLAEGLKKVVTTLLDVVGKLITAYLEAYKAALNAILDVVAFIVNGLVKILKGITNLVLSAKLSPQHFFGQMSEELLGQDVTKPLPNERPLPALASASSSSALSVSTTDFEAKDSQLLQKDSYQSSEVEADQVLDGARLEDELMQHVAALGEGGVVEFGASEDDEHNMEAVKKDAIQSEQTLNEQVVSNNVADTSLSTQTNTTLTNTTGQEEDGMVGPFHTPMERAGHLVGVMKDAVVKWFSENKVAIIAGLIAGIAGVILANILTGGAIMAALPLLLQIIGAYFAAEGIYQTTKYFGGFLGAAWPGNLVEGAAKLARGLAVLTIELVFALLFGGKAALKGAKTAIKTVAKQGVKGAVKTGIKAAKSGIKKSVKETAKAATDLAKVGKSGAQALARNGKVAMKGVRKGFARGAKTFDDLGQRLSKKLRFKKFRLSVKNRRFKLEGEVNPWVLLASGKLEERNIEGEVGDVVKRADGTVEGVIVDPVGSKRAVWSGSSLTKKPEDFKLLHSEELITKSAGYKKIKELSDDELIKSVKNPKNGEFVEINTKTGSVVQGNTRVYEIRRRGLDVDIPYKRYTPDDSYFPDF